MNYPALTPADNIMPDWMKTKAQLNRIREKLRKRIALHKLQTGDILAYRPSSTIQKLIQRVTGQPYGHVALVDKNNNVFYDMTMQEGGRAVPLNELTKSNLGKNIDVLRPRLNAQIRQQAAEHAKRMTEALKGPLNYSYGSLAKALYNLKNRKAIKGMADIDPETAKTCAELVYSAYELAGANLGDRDPALVSPGDFVETKKITPLGTIQGRKAARDLWNLLLPPRVEIR